MYILVILSYNGTSLLQTPFKCSKVSSFQFSVAIYYITLSRWDHAVSFLQLSCIETCKILLGLCVFYAQILLHMHKL